METRTSIRERYIAGFTLVELMVTVVIASILLSIAIPSYNKQIRKSRRTEARSAVLDLASREERYQSTNNAYSQTPADLGYTAWGIPISNGYYQLNVVAGGVPPAAPTYTITATPVAGTSQALDAQCQYFSVTETGAQKSTDSADGSGNDTTTTCWN